MVVLPTPPFWFAIAMTRGSSMVASSAAAASGKVSGSRIGPSLSPGPGTRAAQVTVEGRNLDEVAQVTVAGAPAEIVQETPVAITFAVPAVDDAFRGEAAIELTDAAGTPIEVETPPAPSSPAAAATAELMSAATADAAPAETEGEAEAADAAPAPSHPLTLTYTSDPGIDAQVAYVLKHWSSYNSAQYPVLRGVDCANFASQALVARGWAMDGTWYYDAGTRRMSPAWTSSTALRDYLLTQPGRATPLTDAQRAEVKVGDIAQFDWDGSGDRDHTATVTRVASPGG